MSGNDEQALERAKAAVRAELERVRPENRIEWVRALVKHYDEVEDHMVEVRNLLEKHG